MVEGGDSFADGAARVTETFCGSVNIKDRTRGSVAVRHLKLWHLGLADNQVRLCATGLCIKDMDWYW